MTMIRADYSESRIIERVLQVHGFSSYPDSFQLLIELQQIINPNEINKALAKLLKYLNSLRVFDNKEHKPHYL
jgi:hypothetical protein